MGFAFDDHRLAANLHLRIANVLNASIHTQFESHSSMFKLHQGLRCATPLSDRYNRSRGTKNREKPYKIKGFDVFYRLSLLPQGISENHQKVVEFERLRELGENDTRTVLLHYHRHNFSGVSSSNSEYFGAREQPRHSPCSQIQQGFTGP